MHSQHYTQKLPEIVVCWEKKQERGSNPACLSPPHTWETATCLSDCRFWKVTVICRTQHTQFWDQKGAGGEGLKLFDHLTSTSVTAYDN